MSSKLQLKAATKSQRIVKWMWRVTIGGIAFVALLFILMYNGVIGYMPNIEELRNPTDRFASTIYTSDGVEMGRYFLDKNNRVYVDFDQMSHYLVDALVATEDLRFEEHSGIDIRALSRAIVKRGILRRKEAGGGSTITQQLAKQLYSQPSSSTFQRLLQKPIEWCIAVKLERYYTKDEIVKMYFNQFDFLNNAVGIKSAAFVYFGKTPDKLTIEESALLVGMLKNPSYFNPLRFPERAIERRNVVFMQMQKAGMISEQRRMELSAIPLKISYHAVDHKDGIAPYFREELRRVMTAKKPNRSDDKYKWNKDAFADDSVAWENNPLFGWCEKNTKSDGSHYNILTDGLKIYTSIDSKMQHYAEMAVSEHMRALQAQFVREKGGYKNPYTDNTAELSSAAKAKLIERAIEQSERYRVLKVAGKSKSEIMENFKKPVEMRVFSYHGAIDTVMSPRDSLLYTKTFLRTGMMSMDPITGQVKAYVGGPDFKFFQYDMAARGRRQVGSTVKPFLYTLAMEQGKTPCDTYLNAQPTIIDEFGHAWSPRNSGGGRVGQMVDLRWALTNSNNWISARLVNEFGATNLVRTMRSFGITSALQAVNSLSLGVADISIKEMVTAYTAFANKGMRVDPVYVTRITDNEGNVIADFTPRYTEVISEEAYYKILSILLNVVDSGTGNRLRRAPFNLTAQMGGKTGTTNYNSDGWFMGFTPQLVTGVWVGGDERYIHFRSTASGQGAAMALPIYGKYMKRVYADRDLPYTESVTFEFPPAFNPCARESLGGVPIDMQQEYSAPEEAIEDIFE